MMKNFFPKILTTAALCLAAGACLSAPCFAESKLTKAQEIMLEQCLAPIEAAQKELAVAGNLLRHIRDGKESAKESAPELKRLLDSIEANRKAFMEMKQPEDNVVAKLVSMYMRWNGGKLGTYTNILIQLGTELLNDPDTAPELVDVLKNCFFAPSLHRLSEYSAKDLADAEAEIQVLKQFSVCAREFIRTIESISNKEEADAAAPQVKQLLAQLAHQEKQVRFLSPKGKSDMHQQIIQTAGYTYGFPLIMMELESAIDTISSEHECFGSPDLKAVFDEI